MSISFFTPVVSNQSSQKDPLGFLRPCEKYFALGSKKVTITKFDDGVSVVAPAWEKRSWFKTALKVLSVATIIAPVLALIGKVAYRSRHTFINQSVIDQHLARPTASVDQLTRELAEAQNQVREYEGRCRQLQKSHEVGQAEISRLAGQLREANREVEQAQKELTKARKASSEALKELRDSKAALEQAKQQHARAAQVAQDTADKDLASANARIATLEKELADSKADLKQAKQQHAEAIKETQETATKDLASANARTATLEKELAESREKAATLQSKLDEGERATNEIITQAQEELDQVSRDHAHLNNLVLRKIEQLEKIAAERSSAPPPSSANSLEFSRSFTPIQQPPPPINYKESFDIDKHQNEFNHYVETHCKRISPGQAWDHVQEGARAWGNLDGVSKIEEKDLTNLLWLFMFYAQTQQQAFSEGSFVLNTKVKTLNSLMQNMDKTYRRPSSHLKKNSPSEHNGIDCPGPANKGTVLFTPFENDTLLFIKPENYGTKTLTDFLFHGVEYFFSLQRKIFGGDEEAGMRKERIPAEICSQFKSLVQDKNDEATARLNAEVKGIKFMYSYCLEKGDSLDQTKLNDFKKQLEQYSHLDIRTGNEVIITDDIGILASKIIEAHPKAADAAA